MKNSLLLSLLLLGGMSLIGSTPKTTVQNDKLNDAVMYGNGGEGAPAPTCYPGKNCGD